MPFNLGGFLLDKKVETTAFHKKFKHHIEKKYSPKSKIIILLHKIIVN